MSSFSLQDEVTYWLFCVLLGPSWNINLAQLVSLSVALPAELVSQFNSGQGVWLWRCPNLIILIFSRFFYFLRQLFGRSWSCLLSLILCSYCAWQSPSPSLSCSPATAPVSTPGWPPGWSLLFRSLSMVLSGQLWRWPWKDFSPWFTVSTVAGKGC